MFINNDTSNIAANNKKIAFTICSLNYLHMALSARKSFLLYNQDWEFKIFIHDMIQDKEIIPFLLELSSNEDIFIFSLGLKNNILNFPIEEIFIRYNVYESNTAIKPYIFSYYFNLNYNKICYFDPDIYFYDQIDEIDNLLNTYEIILTPHMLLPCPDDGKIVSNQNINNAGIYNCGFVAMSYSDNIKTILKFWENQLKSKAYSRIEEGLFTDQIWANWFPVMSDKCYILKKYGYNVAYWNMHERTITYTNGKWFVNDEKLVFFHFSGITINNINIISKHQNRYSLEIKEVPLRILFEDYVVKISENNIKLLSCQEYYFNKLPHRTFSLNTERRNKLIIEYLNNRMYPFAGDGDLHLHWTKKIHSRYKYFKFPQKPLHFLKHYLFKRQSFGINIIGYFDELHSIGEIARSLVKMIYPTGIPFSLFNIISGANKISPDEYSEYSLYMVRKPIYPINIFVVNADQIPIVYKQYEFLFKNKTNLGNWIWEFETGFGKYADACKYLDGIVTQNNYVYNCIKKYLPADYPIYNYLYPFIINTNNLIEKNKIREKFNIPIDKFAVFFNFDYNSSYDRKNPEAVLSAFHSAFKDNENACLVLKTTNQKNYSDYVTNFLRLINDYNLSSRIYIIDEFLDKIQMLSLINACNVYISLHRAEGFGLGLLEAMFLGKPVIGTNYSGNLDFMNQDNSILIDAPLVPANTDFGPYKDVELWAEPDILNAASALKNLYDNPELVCSLGEAAQKSVKERFNENKFLCSFYALLKNNF